MDVREQLLRAIDLSDMSDRAISIRATGNADAVSNIKRGRSADPKAGTLEAIAAALGYKLVILPRDEAGPASGPGPNLYTASRDTDRSGLSRGSLRTLERSAWGLSRVVAEAGGDPIPPELRPSAKVAETGPDCGEAGSALAEAHAPGARPVATAELDVAAGGGAVSLDDAPVVRQVWFRREWLDRHGLDPTRCVVIGVRGESMEPTLPNGCSILVARDRRQRRPGRIYVVRGEDGLVVKRAARNAEGWRLTSDHPAWDPAPWPDEAETIGEAVWTARALTPA